MKKIVKISNKNNLLEYSSLCNGYILGYKDFCVGFNDDYEFDEIKNLVELYKDKDIFVSINKNIFNDEIEIVTNILKKLSSISIKGILFYDISILSLVKSNNLNIDLVWNQTHMVTNYNTCNYYYNNGCKYSYISGEITKDEILEINSKTKSKLFVEILSHQVMSHSRRHLLKNYYKSINKDYNGELKEIYDKEYSYLIKDTKEGTTIKTKQLLNGIPLYREFKDNYIEYVVIDETDINKEIIINALNILDNIDKNIEYEKNIEDSYKLLGYNSSFFFKKTIYKVKK